MSSLHTTQDDLNESLYWAIKEGNTQEVAKLLTDGADIDKATIADWTPLAHAADLGRLDIVQTLIERGADVNLKDADGFTALHWAQERDHKEIAALLIKHGGES